MRPLDLLYALAMPFAALAWATKGKHRTDWDARLGKGASLPAAEAGQKTVLIHAVSVGEINATRTLVAELAKRNLRVVVAATTDTGFARANQVYGAQDVAVVRYPFDFSFAVSRLLDRVRPDVFVAMELEVWPHITLECQKRGIPFAVANGRLSERSFKGYAKARALVAPMFSRITCALVQTPAYAGRFRALGTPEVRVLDTMKWDTAVIEDAARVAGALELAEALGIDRSKPLIVAGSTGPGEEELLIRTLPPGAQLLMAPRKPERFDEVFALCPAGTPRRSLGAPLFTAAPGPPASGPAGDALNAAGLKTGEPRAAVNSGAPRVFLLDTMGELRKAYALADVALVGRSFLGLYGSDPFEPVGLGKPTVIGPHYGDFKDAVDALAQAGGLCIAADPMKEAARLLAAPGDARAMAQKGVDVIRARQGVSAKYADEIAALAAG